jgi:hypothetical protein
MAIAPLEFQHIGWEEIQNRQDQQDKRNDGCQPILIDFQNVHCVFSLIHQFDRSSEQH